MTAIASGLIAAAEAVAALWSTGSNFPESIVVTAYKPILSADSEPTAAFELAVTTIVAVIVSESTVTTAESAVGAESFLFEYTAVTASAFVSISGVIADIELMFAIWSG